MSDTTDEFDSTPALTFTDEHRAELEAWLAGPECKPDTADRIKIMAVHAFASGDSPADVATRFHFSPQGVKAMGERYLALGLDGLRWRGVNYVTAIESDDLAALRMRLLTVGIEGAKAWFGKHLRERGVLFTLPLFSRTFGEVKRAILAEGIAIPGIEPRPKAKPGRPRKQVKAARTRAERKAASGAEPQATAVRTTNPKPDRPEILELDADQRAEALTGIRLKTITRPKDLAKRFNLRPDRAQHYWEQALIFLR